MSYIDTQGMTMDDPYDEGKVFKGDPDTYPSFKSNIAKIVDSESTTSKLSTPKIAKPNAPASKISMSKQSWK